MMSANSNDLVITPLVTIFHCSQGFCGTTSQLSQQDYHAWDKWLWWSAAWFPSPLHWWECWWQPCSYPTSDPAPPENLDNPEEVSVSSTKQSTPVNSPADIYHVFFNPDEAFCRPYVLKSSDEIVVNGRFIPKWTCTLTTSLPWRVTLPRLWFTVEQMVELVVQMSCSSEGPLYWKICIIVSQFGNTSIGTPTHSISAQLTCYKHSATNLAIASGASFLPSVLSAVFTAVSIACNRPPAAPDPNASAVLSTLAIVMPLPLAS